MLFGRIDSLALAASSSLSFSTVNAYYNTIEQVYINVASVLKNATIDKIEGLRRKYRKISEIIMDTPKARTIRSLDLLFKIARNYNSEICYGLQEFDYFFRVSSRQPKGLGQIEFFDQSIFGAQSEGKNEPEI